MNARHSADEVAAALGTSNAKFLGRGTFGDTWRVGNTAVKVICEDGYPPERVRREVSGLLRVLVQRGFGERGAAGGIRNSTTVGSWAPNP